jgi:hypothetical protein
MQQIEQIKLQTYRFTYSNDFAKELEYFSKIHKYDDRKTFKEEWTKWIQEENIKNLIETEKQRCIKQDYKGDIMDKIFKSVRYYYRKKKENIKEEQETQENENFTGLSREILKQMDIHINEIIKTHLDKSTNISKINPALAFDDFCNKHMMEITDEIFRLKDKIILKQKEINIKFKKSYKNRFYKIRILLENQK